MRIYSDNGTEYFNRICPYCKENVHIYRNGNKAILCDDKVYHFECFKKMKQVQKKKKNCGKTFSFQDKENINMILYQKGFYCKECFDNLCKCGIEKKSKKWKNALENINIYEDNAKENIVKVLEKRKNSISMISEMRNELTSYAANIFAEYDVNNFIRQNYNLQDVSIFYMRYLKPLYNGTSQKYISITIPPKHLYEMWQTKINYLSKLYQKNISKGMCFTEIQRVAYDLSILVNRYESFLEWKEKQRLLEYETQIVEEIPTGLSQKSIRHSVNNNSSSDVSDILDDIFG